MKVLLLTNEYPPHVYGGAGVHVDYLTRELAKSIDVDVRCFGEQGYEEQRYGHELGVVGYGYDERAFEHTAAKLKSPLQALSRCIGFSAEPVDADIVHCHTWYSHFGGILVKQLYGIPLVITTHSLEPSRPWKREQLGLGYDLSCWIEKCALEMANAVVAVSEGMREDVLRLFSVDTNRLSVIHNGIDTDEYQPAAESDVIAQCNVDLSQPYVLFVGRVTRQKGIIHLVNAIKYLEPGIQVVLCAGAPDTAEIAEEMSTSVRKVQANRDGVVWINRMVDKRTIIELYSHAAVFCCPSIYEPFGIILLEAMACCTPVVASAVGGIKEVVADGETGFLVPIDQYDESPFEPKDPDLFSRQLAEPINRLMADEGMRARMGEAGRKRATEVFSWRAIAQNVLALYQRVLQGTPS